MVGSIQHRAAARRAAAGRAAALARADAFTLVTLVIFVTVLNVMVAVALPLWTQQIQRDKEEELIFRGLQYAEAIRVFQTRQGRYPVRLEELLEIQPRAIRQLWKDPMTGDGKWELILADGVQPGQPGQPTQGRTLGGQLGGGQQQQQDDRRRLRRRSSRREAETVTVGPITGVHSKSEKKAIKSFNGGDTYKSWLFTVDLLPIAPSAPGELIPSLNSRWVGRPFPEGIEPAEGTGIEDALEDDEEEDEPDDRRRRRGRRNRQRDG